MTNLNRDKAPQQKIIGLLPAGGKAVRLAPLPFSKELYPIGFQPLDDSHNLRPKVVCHYLLEKMRFAGITEAYIVLRNGKWDIPAYLGDGTMLDMHLAYLIVHIPFGVPYTIDQAYPFVHDALIAFGFPDIIFQPEDAFVQLLKRQAAVKADVVLGIFPTDEPNKWDMVDLDESGKIHKIVIKPRQSNLHYTWINAVWTSAFTQFIHEYLSANDQDKIINKFPDQRELFIGNVIQAAIEKNMHVEGVLFPNGACLDIGTPNDLIKVLSNISCKGDH